jgi:fermentation-respiration switch protein FrsA (DUF1100 family)
MIWLKYSIYVLLVLIPVIIAISIYCAAVIVRHRTFIESDCTPADFGLAYTPFSVNATRDAVLAGWFIPAKTSCAVIIASHGVADSKNGILAYLVPYIEAGFSLAVYDLRHHKDSTGKYCSLGYWESRDLLCITEYVQVHFADGQPICYWGFSLGATVSLMAAARTDTITAIIAQSPFVSIHQVVAHYAMQFYHLPPWPFVSIALRFMEWITRADTREVNICRIAGKLADMPVLLIGSPDDTQVPLHWLETIQRVLGDSADLLVGPYGHMDLGMEDETYEPERQEIIHSTAFLKNAVSE